MAIYPALIYQLVKHPVYAKHAAALASNGALQQAIVRLLLRRCLPATVHRQQPDAFTEMDVGRVAQVLSMLGSTEQLRPAVEIELCQPGVAAAVVQQAAAMAATLPASRPAGLHADFFAHAHNTVLMMLAFACKVLVPQPCVEDMAGSAGAAGTFGTASSAGGSSADAASGCQAQARAWAPGSEEWWAVTSAVLRLVPHFAALLCTLAADAECQQHSLVKLCSNVCRLLEVLLLENGGIASVTATTQQTQAWAAAAEAGMRLQPLLTELHAQPDRKSVV